MFLIFIIIVMNIKCNGSLHLAPLTIRLMLEWMDRDEVSELCFYVFTFSAL